MEIALGLSIADDRLNMAEQALQKVVQLLESWEDYDAEIGGKIEDAIDDGTYLKIRNLPAGNINWKDICSWTELNALQTIVAGAPSALSPQPDIKLLAKWALFRKQNALASKLAVKDYGAARFESGYVSGINWVRNDRIFVTVVSKQDAPPLELPEKLLKALCDWDPAPHRLLMSKMRAELDERGVWAEGRVLGDRHLQAGWLSEYLTDDLDERQWKVHSTVNRHWEGLGDSIRNNVVEFADRLATHLRGEGREKAIGKWYPSVAQDEMTYSLNHYVSSKSVVEGGYLTTGHVLRLDSDVGDGCFWLCLSPACDLVPGQKSTGWYKRLGAHTPFIAVQLFDANKEDALQQAASGNHLFLKINDVFKSFSFTPASTDAVRATNPKWEQMFAAQQGRFQGEDNKFMVARAADGENGLLAFKSEPAQVVAHLRYEYALNLLHRLGANLSRVGLDFVGMRPAGNG
ncbi:hypothetical protein CXB49_10875 [Chromobacterium sp. ATCC 53434]|nr:hypothetical protein CXB49_10875 [Chromobacterium sp. ATCC 53434]